MAVWVNRDKCGYCGACVSVCPKNTLELAETRVEVGEDCIECKACVSLCPMGALDVEASR